MYAFAISLVFGRSNSRLEAVTHVVLLQAAFLLLPVFTNVQFVNKVRLYVCACVRSHLSFKPHVMTTFSLDAPYHIIQLFLALLPALALEPVATSIKAKTT